MIPPLPLAGPTADWPVQHRRHPEGRLTVPAEFDAAYTELIDLARSCPMMPFGHPPGCECGTHQGRLDWVARHGARAVELLAITGDEDWRWLPDLPAPTTRRTR